jgi:hypothetical protein
MNDLLRIQPTRIYIFLCIFERPNFPVSSLLRLAIGRPFQVDDRSSGINSMTTLLPASLQNSLQEIVQRSNQRAACIRAILLSTTEGVPLGRVIAPATTSSTDGGSGGGESNALQEDGLAAIESVWAPASKQFPVLGLEKVRHVGSHLSSTDGKLLLSLLWILSKVANCIRRFILARAMRCIPLGRFVMPQGSCVVWRICSRSHYVALYILILGNYNTVRASIQFGGGSINNCTTLERCPRALAARAGKLFATR